MTSTRITPPPVIRIAMTTAFAVVALTMAIAHPAEAATKPIDARNAGQISAAVAAPVSVSYNRATGAVSFLRVADGSQASLSTGSGSRDERARSFFASQSSLFGIRSAQSELAQLSETADNAGQRTITYQQYYRGLPVYAALLRAHFDNADRLHAVNGVFVPGITTDVQPAFDALTASRRAITYSGVRNNGEAGLSAGTPKLEIYRVGLDKGVAGPSVLVYEVEVSNGGEVHEFVFVDAHSGKVIDFAPGVFDALNRRAFIGTDGTAPANSPQAWPASPDWVEGNAIPSGIQERDNMLISTQDVYNNYKDAFGRLSYDGLDHVMDQAYNRDYQCPNASWNGNLISFCPGFTTHDVTAHEWSHAYTSFTHGLIYKWQSGALNEAYSDMYGEAFDQRRTLSGMVDTDTPNNGRTAAACSTLQLGVPREILVNSPGGLAGLYPSGQPSFGPNVVSPVTSNLVLAIDDGTTTADVNDACETTPLVNAAALAGKIAFVNRGTCSISEKTLHVQAAGAIAMILGNVSTSASPTLPSSAVCGTVPDCSGVTIPTLTLNLANADLFRAQLATPINATGRTPAGTNFDNSVRWLMGEDVAGGALRDMWNPVCFANPGKISDSAQYACDPGLTDNGGVHTNSGIPNHAFALLTDGGTYNGFTVNAIGMVKAMNLIFRAQTVYQTPASDFGDHADALEASCSDLVTAATSLPDPWGGPPQIMAAGDCTAVHQAILAVEMRNEPTFCNFQPLLAQNPPALCVTGFAYTTKLYDWEAGASGWTTSQIAVTPGTFDATPWSLDNSLPDSRPGQAFHGNDPAQGDCGADDESGALRLESPALKMPSGGMVPRIAFDHQIGTEASFDGGNLKVSTDGGTSYAVVPAASYTYNAPGLLTGPPTNTSPIAGEAAWNGTDGGTNSGGTWGRSIGTLSGQVAAGQSFRFRFDLGRDGCGGTNQGWWVDDVRVYVCTPDEGLLLDGFEDGNSSRWSQTVP